MTVERKRLFFDLETSENVVRTFYIGRKVHIGYDDIEEEARIICIAWKWEGQNKVYALDWGDKQDDKQLLKKFIPIMNQADEVIGQNHESFDIRWLRGRAMYHRLPMPPEYTTLDTYRLMKRAARLNSYRLDYLIKYFHLGEGKQKIGKETWRAIERYNDQKALKKMIRYNKEDVRLTEELFNLLNQYIKPKTTIARRPVDCPECGSGDTIVNNTVTRATGARLKKMQCKNCYKYFSIPESKFNKYAL